MFSAYDYIGAAGDLKVQLAFILGMRNVQRYHTIDTIKPDTVAGHSHGTAWLCYLLMEGKPTVSLLMAALSHDAAEQLWGDIPSPAKKYLGLRETLTSLERTTLALNNMEFELTPHEAHILKIADNMDGLLSSIRERRLGNRNAEPCYERFHEYTLKLLPEPPLEAMAWNVLREIEVLWEDCLG